MTNDGARTGTAGPVKDVLGVGRLGDRATVAQHDHVGFTRFAASCICCTAVTALPPPVSCPTYGTATPDR